MNFRKVTAGLLTLTLLGAYFYFEPFQSEQAEAAGSADIRQEINILNRYFPATAGSQATSSELVYINPSNYSGTVTYYLEIVASTSISLSNDTYLISSNGVVLCTATIPTLTTSMTLIRSSACTLPTTADTYRFVIGNSAIGNTSVKAARVVVLQDFADFAVNATSTRTQIEIGSYINASTTSGALTAPSNPKYWTYASSSWDGVKMFSVQVTYQTTLTASSTTYTTSPATTTLTTSPGQVQTVVELWGAGGGGRCSASTAGGSGGAGGGYVRSTTSPTVGSVHTLHVPAGGNCGVTTATSSAAWDTNVVRAPSGAGSAGATAITAVATTSSEFVGQIEFNGGTSGAAATSDDTGGGGGASAGPVGAGGGGAIGQATVGGGGGGGNGGSTATTQAGGASATGGTGGTGGNAGAGVTASSSDTGGGGGGGSDNAQQGGAGGAPGGGAGGGDTTGTNAKGGGGQAKITEWIGMATFILQQDDGNFGTWTNKVTIARDVFSTSSAKMASSSEFFPVDGRHYRLVASTTSGTYSVFNAKIIVDSVTSATGTIQVMSLSTTTVVDIADAGLTIPAPSGLIEGDFMLAVVSGGATNISQWTGPTGWTEVFDQAANAHGVAIYSKRATSDDAATSSWKWIPTDGSSKNIAGGLVMRLSGAGDVQANTSATGIAITNLKPATITPMYANSLFVLVGTESNNNPAVRTVSGQAMTNNNPTWTERADTGATDGTGTMYSIATALRPETTSSGDFTITFDASTDRAYAIALVITPQIRTGTVTLLEPQYLLANTTLNSGTSLQNALTKWVSAEWGGASTTFQHQLDSAGSSASDGEVDTAGGTLVTGSEVTNPNNLATSSLMTMPADGNLDMKLTTNNNDVYASRILVRVSLVGAGGGDSGSVIYIESEFWYE